MRTRPGTATFLRIVALGALAIMIARPECLLSTLTTTKRRAELGPKSQRRDCKHRYLLFALLLLLSHTPLAEGAGTGLGKPRVVIGPATMMGASTGSLSITTAEEAKTCGEGLQRPSTAIRKVAFRRATARAQRAGLAQCRGQTMQAAQRTDPPTQPRPLPASRGSCNPPRSPARTSRVTVTSYNAGGLSTRHYTELLAWLHIQRRQRRGPDVVMIQETHWLGEHDYSNDEWHVLSTGCTRACLCRSSTV